MSHLRFTSLLAVILITTSFPQLKYNYELSGNRIFENSVIEKYLNSFPASDSKQIIDSVNYRLKILYQNNGYFRSHLDASVEVLNEPYVLRINIEENNPAKVTGITLKYSDTISNRISSAIFSELNNSVYSSSRLNESIAKCLEYYQDNGYPFCEIKIDGILINSFCDSVNIGLTIDKKSPSKIIDVESSEKITTNKNVIIREINFTGTRPYNQQWINSIPNRLMKLKLFESVREPLYIPLSRGEGLLKIPIKERNNNNFDGVVGYVPGNNKNESGYLSGFVDISFNNLLGTARAARFHWQKINRLSSILEFAYTEPWMFSYPLSSSVSFFQNKQDSIFISYGTGLNFEYLVSDGFYFSIYGGISSVVPSIDTKLSSLVPKSSKTTGGVGLRFDNRDDPFVPTQGILISNQIYYAAKSVSSVSNSSNKSTNKIQQQKILLDVSSYNTIFKNTVLYYGLYAKYLTGESKDISDVFRIGGAKSLRGYSENQFYSDKLLLGKAELRGVFDKRSFAFIFIDGALLNSWSVSSRAEHSNMYSRVGYGLGLSFSTNLGILSVSFALGKGDDFSTGKIHFGIQNDF